jgi:hypothetical protein
VSSVVAAMPAPVAGRHVWKDACTSRVLCSGELPSESVFGWFPVSALKVALSVTYSFTAEERMRLSDVAATGSALINDTTLSGLSRQRQNAHFALSHPRGYKPESPARRQFGESWLPAFTFC